MSSTAPDPKPPDKERPGAHHNAGPIKSGLTKPTNHDQPNAPHLQSGARDPWHTRKAGFAACLAILDQVELDALPPEVPDRLFKDALSEYRDTSRNNAVLERTAKGDETLAGLASQWWRR